MDLDQLRHHVDEATFRRGLYYADHGAVLTLHPVGDDRVNGRVRGNSPTPYDVSVSLTRDGARLTRFAGSCSCPVGLDCKHAVALAIVALRREPGDATSVWESALAGLFDEPPVEERPPLALQVALTDAGAPSGASIELRPVVPGRNGAWVRTGVSWTSLTRSYYRWTPPGSAQAGPRYQASAQLLGEILAMSGRSSYAPAGAPVRLQDVPTRRIWLLLAEAASVGLPLVGTGRDARPVRLADAVDVGLDVSAAAGDVELTIRLTHDGSDIAADGLRLIGETPHGVAWWTFRRKQPELTLAPLSGTLDEVVAAVAARGGLRVPEADSATFLTRYLPRLQRRVNVGSADRTLTVLAPEPPTLVLRVSHLVSGGLRLRWSWRYLGRESGLRPDGAGPDRDPRHEARLLEAVTAAADGVADLSDDDGLLAETALVGYDAVRFRGDVLPRLEQLDGVEIDVDPTLPDYREAMSSPLVRATAEPHDDDWYDLAVSVDVDGEHVAFELLFMAIARGRSHLLLPSGTWFSLNTPELSALAILIAESQTLEEPDRKPLTVSRYRPDTWADLVHLGVIDAQAAQWRSRMLTLDEPAAPGMPTVVPATLRATLRPYQVDGFRWLAERADRGLGAVLADEMGLGKTLQAIALMCHLPGSRFLVVAPTSVVPNWASELARFAPHLVVAAVEGTGRRRGTTLEEATAGADVVVTSYALLRLEFDAYAAQEWSAVFLDEAQFVKNRQSQTYDCAKRLPAMVKIAMTGTPFENTLMELWSVFSIVAPGLFSDASHFEHHYGATIGRGSEERLVKLRRRVAPFLLRRTKAEVANELPERQEQLLSLQLNAEHHRGYQLLLQRERQKVLRLLADDGIAKNRFQVLRSLTMLRLAALDMSLAGAAPAPSTKLDALVDLVTELAEEHHRTLIFSQFTSFLGLARARLEATGIACSYLDGSTSSRGDVVEGFRSGTTPVFLISLKAGGFGLNLVEADYVILLDPWWNPAAEAQAIDRAHRIGQTRNVMVYRLVAQDTIEEKVMALAAKKAELFSAVLDGGDGTPAGLDVGDIRELLSL